MVVAPIAFVNELPIDKRATPEVKQTTVAAAARPETAAWLP
jgi:hypothetical protein